MKFRWGAIMLAAILAALSPAAVCAASGPLTLTEKDRGRTITLKVGQMLILNLRDPGDGGYSVNPPVFDAGILHLTSATKIPPARPLPGDFGQFHYEWTVASPGQTGIIITIYRPWMKKAPEEYWRVKVLVQ